MGVYTYTKNDEMLARAKKVIPGGVYGHLGPVHGHMLPVSAYPKFAEKAKGAYFWDIDGNKFIDYMCAYGPNILGYGDEDVDKAALEQLKLADCTTSPSYKMVEFAELMVDTVKSADWAFFCKNGGDVTTLAVMAARAATGRKKVVFVDHYYHGVAQWTHMDLKPGVLPGEIEHNLIIPFNDVEAFKKVIADNKDDIACFISTPYMHGALIDNVLPEEGYWKEIRRLCTENGIVLAMDDVRCGFRIDLAGSDHYFGIEADLICFCKALANGWNISCLCGKDFLKDAIDSMLYTGSYWLSAVPIAAGIACVSKLKRLDAANALQEIGRKLSAALQKAADENGVKFNITGIPSLFYMRTAADFGAHREWVAEMTKRGVFMTNHHNHFTNMAMTDEDIKYTAERADECFKIIKKNHPEIDFTQDNPIVL